MEEDHEKHNFDDAAKEGLKYNTYIVLSLMLLLNGIMPPKISGITLLTKDFWKLASELLSRKTDEIRRGHHCNVIEDEVPQLLIRSCKVHCYGCRYERPEDIDHHGHMACRPETDSCKVPWVYPRPTALPIRLDASRDLMSIVIEGGHMRMVSMVHWLFSHLLNGMGYTNVLLLDVFLGIGPLLPSKSAKHCVAKK